MRILAVNPNTSTVMTEAIGAVARQVASPGTEVIAWNPARGPDAIENHLDETRAAGHLLDLLEGVRDGPMRIDGVAIACYGDPGLDAARELLAVPVVGIAEASMLLACTVGHRFGIVAASERARPLMIDVVSRNGLTHRLGGVAAAGLGVLDIVGDPSGAFDSVRTAARRLIEQSHVEVICLGCAAMGHMVEQLREDLGVPVIDGVQAAVKTLEGLIGLGLTTSRVAAYRRPTDPDR